MRCSQDKCAEYLSGVGALLERFGATLDLPDGTELELLEEDDGTLSFEIVGSLPDGTHPALARLAVREGFRRISPDLYERSRYEYELVDVARDFRRAFHLHFPEWFGRRFLVVVHEHSERPIGHVACDHYAGRPMEDAFAGVTNLMDAWTAEPPECGALTCLE
ncbi:MAG: hypothetical protein Q7S35_01815 [Candidatus Limnocylindrales bacterium]|nr:hypothetical protein [Candidatus Limnocylindrales bacterium]